MSEPVKNSAIIERNDVKSTRSLTYVNSIADSVLVAKIEKRMSDGRSENLIALNFFKDQVVPTTDAQGDTAFQAEEVLLATFLLSQEQAEFVMESIKRRLEK